MELSPYRVALMPRGRHSRVVEPTSFRGHGLAVLTVRSSVVLLVDGEGVQVFARTRVAPSSSLPVLLVFLLVTFF